mmetsp:Transcript_6777/g.11236  ORF Transcript_6777/g.11236 Transcript_6777/m.11236 type:complete len:241 (-) Transcript_6777:380-1102(-)
MPMLLLLRRRRLRRHQKPSNRTIMPIGKNIKKSNCTKRPPTVASPTRRPSGANLWIGKHSWPVKNGPWKPLPKKRKKWHRIWKRCDNICPNKRTAETFHMSWPISIARHCKRWKRYWKSDNKNNNNRTAIRQRRRRRIRIRISMQTMIRRIHATWKNALPNCATRSKLSIMWMSNHGQTTRRRKLSLRMNQSIFAKSFHDKQPRKVVGVMTMMMTTTARRRRKSRGPKSFKVRNSLCGKI